MTSPTMLAMMLLAGSGLTVTTLEPVELPYVGHHPVHRWVRR